MLVLPDIHGRQFWKEAVKQARKGEKIIFLGDYLDPYALREGISNEEALDNFKEIIAYKQAHTDQVILLLGNHDVEYFLDTPACRYDSRNWDEIEQLFTLNRSLFQVGYYTEINGQKYTFSHSCITEGWMKQSVYLLGCKSPQEVIDQVNRMDDKTLGCILGQISTERGGTDDYGSMVWADAEEARKHLGWGSDTTYQVFGHTQQLHYPIFRERFAMLDCRQAFRLKEKSNKEHIADRFSKVRSCRPYQEIEE